MHRLYPCAHCTGYRAVTDYISHLFASAIYYEDSDNVGEIRNLPALLEPDCTCHQLAEAEPRSAVVTDGDHQPLPA